MPKIIIQVQNYQNDGKWETIPISKIMSDSDSIIVGGEFKIIVDDEMVYHRKTHADKKVMA